METLIVFNVINPYILLGIGVILLGLEAVISSFILIWFGIGFIITAAISYFYPYSDGIWQLATASIISLVLLILLRKRVLESFLDSQKEITDNFLNEKGKGVIKNSKVFYKGTYWEIESDLDDSDFIEGEKVLVSKTYKNFAKISKK